MPQETPDTNDTEVLDPYTGSDEREELQFATPEERGDFIPDDEQPVEETEAAAEEAQVADELGATPNVEEDSSTQEPEAQSPETTTEAAPSIPKTRLDVEVAKRKALEVKIAEIERRERAAAEAAENKFDFDAREEAYMEAVLDGDKEKARTIRAEIRAAESAQYQYQAAVVQDAAVTQTREQLEFDNAIQTAVTAHPELNTESESYNQDLLNMTNTMFAGLVSQGYQRADAMNLAVNQVMGMRQPTELGSMQEAPAAPVPGTKQTEVAKKVEAATAQPPSTSALPESNATGTAEMAPDITRMSDEEFDAWAAKNPAKFAEMRGDIL